VKRLIEISIHFDQHDFDQYFDQCLDQY